MRKKMIQLVIIGFAVALTSCDGGFEGDVRKSAKYRCQEQKLEEKAETDEKAAKQLEDLREEIEALDEKMEKKYDKMEDDEKMKEKAIKIMMEEMAKCK
jgi:peptidoglycan hydrolase CwlO-like protein